MRLWIILQSASHICGQYGSRLEFSSADFLNFLLKVGSEGDREDKEDRGMIDLNMWQG